MSTRSLRLEFAPSPWPARAWQGVAVLVALGLAVAVAADFAHLRDATAGVEMRLDDAAARELRARERSGNRDANRAAAQAVAVLNVPWRDLLGSVEEVTARFGKDVALLGIEPDLDAGKVRLVAETRSLPVALGYLAQLQAAGALHGALLDRHEVQADVAQRPVLVEIVAEWETGL